MPTVNFYMHDSSVVLVLALVAAVPIIGIAVATAWRFPGVVFGLYLTIPFYKGALDSHLPVDLTLLLWALVLIPILQLILNPARYHLLHSVVLIWIAVFMVILFSMAFAILLGDGPNLVNPFSYVFNYFALLWIPGFAAFRVVGEKRAAMQMLKTMALIGSLTVIMGLIGFSTLGEFDRVTTLGTNTIGTARAALWAPLVLFPLYWHKRGLRMPLLLFACLAFFVAVSSGSRGPVMFFLLAVAALWLSRTKRSRVLAYVISLGVAATLAGFLTTLDFVTEIIPSQSLWRIQAFVDGVIQALTGQNPQWDTSSAARLELWSIAWNMAEEHPFVGGGASSFGHHAEQAGMPGYNDGPHNLFLHILSELGMVGVAIFGLLFAYLIFNALQRAPNPVFTVISGMFLFRICESFVGTGIHDRQSWLIFALMLAVPMVYSESVQSVKDRINYTSPPTPNSPTQVRAGT